MRYADRLSELAARRGGLPRGAKFVVLCCAGCETQYLYDEAGAELYLDPDDLALRVRDAEAAACRGCGQNLWELCELDPDLEVELERGPWGFCFWSPPDEASARVHPWVRTAGLVAVTGLALLGAAALMVNPDPLSPQKPARPQLDLR